jgi:hypothetical protein
MLEHFFSLGHFAGAASPIDRHDNGKTDYPRKMPLAFRPQSAPLGQAIRLR